MYDHIKKDFPNASLAIQKMYQSFDEEKLDEAKGLHFENPEYVYEAIANLIPLNEKLNFDIKTKELSEEYKHLNMCSWNRFVSIRRIDLLMAFLLFTEEFILQKLSNTNVIYNDTKLVIHGNFVTFKVSKHTEKTYISIEIKDVMLFEYLILN